MVLFSALWSHRCFGCFEEIEPGQRELYIRLDGEDYLCNSPSDTGEENRSYCVPCAVAIGFLGEHLRYSFKPFKFDTEGKLVDVPFPELE